MARRKAGPARGSGPEQVLIRVGERSGQIDKEIAPLIKEVWTANIETVECREEGRPGAALVVFATSADAEVFLNIVAVYEEGEESLYRRITHNRENPDGPAGVPLWDYSARPLDGALRIDAREDGVEEYHEGPPDFFLKIYTWIPRTDLPEILKRLRAHNRQRRKSSED
jgi:hypothetical protein